MGCGDEKLSKYLTLTFIAHCNAMICQQVTLSGDAEWPKVADAVIEAGDTVGVFDHYSEKPLFMHTNPEGLFKDGIKSKQLQMDWHLAVSSGHGYRDVSQLRHTAPQHHMLIDVG